MGRGREEESGEERERKYKKNEHTLQYYFVIAYLEGLKPVYIHTGITQHNLTSQSKRTNNDSTAWFYKVFFFRLSNTESNVFGLTKKCIGQLCEDVHSFTSWY